uniref:Putative transcription elongation factor tat-sf1 n=1 Tax=Lutzomyia longipalpis TaxID=7200 RepID=A0A1B0CDY9_LUTLO
NRQVESVDLALNILDGYEIRGRKLRVERAEFHMRGEYNPALKPKRRKKDKEKVKKMKEKLFDWRPDKMRGERAKHERVVTVKNLFTPETFDKEVQLILEYQNDLREECKKCGTVRKVIIYDRHPEGVAQVTMADPDEADLVVKLLHGRFFGQKKLTAELWDGKAKYKIVETEEEALERKKKWDTKLRVERAEFHMRGEYNPALKPKRRKKDKEKVKKMKEKLFDWRPDKMRGERAKHERVVTVKNLFTPETFDKEVQLILEYQNDLREECKKCGTVRKVIIYDRHPEGVAQVTMADPDEADLVVKLLHGRFFGQKKLTAELWDGKTKYKIVETEEEALERKKKWDTYLEQKEKQKEDDDSD